MGAVTAVAPTVTRVTGDGGVLFRPDSTQSLDGKIWTPEGGTHVKRNTFARYRFTTSANGVFVSYVATNNVSPTYGQITVYCNGTYAGAIAVTADSTERMGYVALPAGSNKTVDVVDGPGQLNGSSVVVGSYVTGVAFADSASTITAYSAPSRRLVIYGDSISDGYDATIPGLTGWGNQIRWGGWYPGSVTFNAFGVRSFTTDTNTIGLAATAAQLVADLDGTSTNELWIELGFNDYNANVMTPAQVVTAAQTIITTVRASRPNTKIWWQSLLITAQEGVANGLGFAPPAYRSAVQDAAAGVSNCTFVDGSTLCSVGNLFDGVHPNDTGHPQIANNIRTVMGL